MKKRNSLSRRQLINQLLKGGLVIAPATTGALPYLARLSGLSTTRSGRAFLKSVGIDDIAYAQSVANHRFIQIFLDGGWDCNLTTDPIVGTKSTSGVYASGYNDFSTATVSGKSNLLISSAFSNASSAFANVNTAFVNGMFMEVTAHELASWYMLSGRLSLSRSLEYPAFIALMGRDASEYPPHVVIGKPIILGETKLTSPPLQGDSIETIRKMLRGPENGNMVLSAASQSATTELINTLNSLQASRLPASAQTAAQVWQTAESELATLYDQPFETSLVISDAMRSAFNISNDNPSAEQLAGVSLTLKSGLSNYVSVSVLGFDTHNNHFGDQDELLANFASSLTALVNDLRNTADPLSAGESIMDNTTILLSSEFNRTPGLNVNNGTDHWQTASAVLMGRGVVDNVVIGATDDQASAMGWENGAAVTATTSNRILPNHLAVAILNHLGFTDAASEFNVLGLGGLFS